MVRWTSLGACQLLLAIIAADFPALAASPALSACNPYDGTLERTTPDVVHDDVHFVIDGKKYSMRAFSLAGPAPWAPNFLCLRYELENLEGEKIPLVYWHLLNEYTQFDLKARERIRGQSRKPSASKTAHQGPTKIEAFRQKATTTAWQTIEDYKKVSMSDNPYLTFARSAVLDSAAARAVEERQIPDVEVAVVEASGNPVGTPPLVNDILIAPFGQIETSSSVYIAGNARDLTRASYGVSSTITIKPKANVKIQGFAPALLALQQMRGSATTERFLEELKGSRRAIPALADKHVFSASSLAVERSQRVFIVEHPVTVQWTGPEGEGSVCMKVSLYSPFPVSVGQDYCVK